MEWVEVKGRSVEVAIEAALLELGLESADAAEIEILQEPERGFLGLGGRDAIVRVKPRTHRRQRRRRGRQRESRSRGGEGESVTSPPATQAGAKQEKAPEEEAMPDVDPEDQAKVVEGFLTGLLNAFGFEGTVSARVEDEVVLADVAGEQTEALIGERAVILQALHELTRTVVQRQTKQGVRLRLDIAGYAQRRREALAIYAQRLAEQVRQEGQEIMLEPMNAADRKVIHDSVADIGGVRTYSEGEDPHRSVILAPDEEPAQD
ncbi:MAG TPA: RNA-binding cell elongation regulator Jag/EloR [Acidimicrobiia bacterium]